MRRGGKATGAIEVRPAEPWVVKYVHDDVPNRALCNGDACTRRRTPSVTGPAAQVVCARDTVPSDQAHRLRKRCNSTQQVAWAGCQLPSHRSLSGARAFMPQRRTVRAWISNRARPLPASAPPWRRRAARHRRAVFPWPYGPLGHCFPGWYRSEDRHGRRRGQCRQCIANRWPVANRSGNGGTSGLQRGAVVQQRVGRGVQKLQARACAGCCSHSRDGERFGERHVELVRIHAGSCNAHQAHSERGRRHGMSHRSQRTCAGAPDPPKIYRMRLTLSQPRETLSPLAARDEGMNVMLSGALVGWSPALVFTDVVAATCRPVAVTAVPVGVLSGAKVGTCRARSSGPA